MAARRNQPDERNPVPLMQLHPGTSFTNDVIVVDGMWGTGKSILSSLVGSLDRVEKKKIDHIFEYICIGRHLNLVTEDYARTIVRIYADLDQYNNVIGREVNLRLGDDSGFRNTPGSWRYIKRMFGAEGDQIVDTINSQNLAVQLVTHHVRGIAGPLHDALGRRLFLLEVVRHPFYLINYWTRYLSDFGRSREFTLATDLSGERVPWFAVQWSDEYRKSSVIDRAIKSIVHFLGPTLEATTVVEDDTTKKELVVPFEQLVCNTHEELGRVSSFLRRSASSSTRSAFRKQGVPRLLSDEGRASNVRSWLANPNMSVAEQLNQIRSWVKHEASSRNALVMDELAERYEDCFSFNDLPQ